MEDTNLDFDVITTETLLALFHRASRLMMRGHRHGDHTGHGQARVLAMLKELGTVNQRDLMDRLGVRSASLSELLAKLEAKGLIRRERDEQDKRNFVITVTPEGDATETTREQAVRDSANTLFAALNEDERQALGQLLIKLIIGWEEAFPGHEACRGGHGHCGRHGRHGMGRGRGHGHRMDDGERGPHGCHDVHGHDEHGRHGCDKHGGPGRGARECMEHGRPGRRGHGPGGPGMGHHGHGDGSPFGQRHGNGERDEQREHGDARQSQTPESEE